MNSLIFYIVGLGIGFLAGRGPYGDREWALWLLVLWGAWVAWGSEKYESKDE